MAHFTQEISEKVWDVKYRYRYQGRVIDKNIDDTLKRIAKSIASVEKKENKKHWENKFHDILENFRFLPGGRIIAGAGTQHKVTLFNCFVMHISEDSLSGIFDGLKEGALTLQQGGGIGYDFSILRPRGEFTSKTGSIASGPVSFMRVWDSMSATMISTGFRRGAMMGILRCDHPDIEEFILAKHDPLQLRHFNVSVLVTDEFMKAVVNHEKWPLVFPFSPNQSAPKEWATKQSTLKEWAKDKHMIRKLWSGSSEPQDCIVFRYVDARSLWEMIIQSAYESAEPGVLFEDTINRMNPLWYCERINATNPCGEIPLPPYGACNLGSINLTTFVRDPFSDNPSFDWAAIEDTIEVSTRFLDNVIDVSTYPLKAQKQAALNTRRIGLGFTGLADALVMLGIRYGDKESLEFAQTLMKKIAYGTFNASIELAKEKGSFLLLDPEKYVSGAFISTLPEEIRANILKFGLRNSHHNAIAPTGSISILANNVSNGVEPIYSTSYERKIRLEGNDTVTFKVSNYALNLWRKMHKHKDNLLSLPKAWVDSQSLDPQDHLSMQATLQPFIDNAISKTLNLPEKFPYSEVKDIYLKSYHYGLKGCTIFRNNPITGQVLGKRRGDGGEDEVDPCCPL